MRYFIIVSLLFLPLISFAQESILVDGKFEEWTAYPISFTDDNNDGGSSNIDFGELQISNDESYLYFIIEVGDILNLQDENNISIYIDTDDNVNSGISINGIGADLVYEFGEREGTFYVGSNSTTVYHNDIGLITAPTVTSDRFEIAIRRDINIFGTSVFPTEDIAVVFRDDGPNGDILAPTGNGVNYSFATDQISTLPNFSLSKATETDFRIMSYNALFDGLFDQSRIPAFSRIFQGIQPDVIGFQEIYDFSSEEVAEQMESILPSTNGEQWYHAKEGPDCHAISRYPILESARIAGQNQSSGNAAFLIDHPDIETNMLLVVAHPPCCNNNSGRQKEADLIMEFIRESKAGNGPIPITLNTPIIIVGDMNFVGNKQQLSTLLTGDIVNEAAYGEDFSPDWDGNDLIDSHPYVTNLPFSFSWYAPGSSFSPGRLDFTIYSGSNLILRNNFALFTPELSSDTLSAYGMQVNDVLIASDHLPIVSDFSLNVIVNQGKDRAVQSLENLKIYPNPAMDQTTISFDLEYADIVSFELFDFQGNLCKEFNSHAFSSGNQSFQLEISELPSGSYFLQVTGSDFVQYEHFLHIRQ